MHSKQDELDLFFNYPGGLWPLLLPQNSQKQFQSSDIVPFISSPPTWALMFLATRSCRWHQRGIRRPQPFQLLLLLLIIQQSWNIAGTSLWGKGWPSVYSSGKTTSNSAGKWSWQQRSRIPRHHNCAPNYSKKTFNTNDGSWSCHGCVRVCHFPHHICAGEKRPSKRRRRACRHASTCICSNTNVP